MIRFPLWATVALLVLGAKAHGEPPVDIYELTCFDDGKLVGRPSDSGLVVRKQSGWQRLPLEKDVLRLWRSPDARIFAIDLGGKPWSAVEVPHDSGPIQRWTVPADNGSISFTWLDGPDVVTADHIYRLDPGGKVTELGETPAGAHGERSLRAPEILVSQGTTVVCTGKRMRHDDFVWGNCRELGGTYSYAVDFGDGLCCNEGEGSFATPFVCGDFVVSAIRQWSRTASHNRTQARSLTTGRLLGRRDGAALRGSTCVDGKRALLVGKRDVQIVSVPLLHRLWQQKQDSEIGAVAVCQGGTRAVIVPRGNPDAVKELDLTGPATFGKAKVVPRGMHVVP